jgi:hypothetical protein
MERYDNLIEKWLLMMLLEIGILLYKIKKIYHSCIIIFKIGLQRPIEIKKKKVRLKRLKIEERTKGSENVGESVSFKGEKIRWVIREK